MPSSSFQKGGFLLAEHISYFACRGQYRAESVNLFIQLLGIDRERKRSVCYRARCSFDCWCGFVQHNGFVRASTRDRGRILPHDIRAFTRQLEGIRQDKRALALARHLDILGKRVQGFFDHPFSLDVDRESQKSRYIIAEFGISDWTSSEMG